MDIRKLSQNIQEETEKIIVGKSDRDQTDRDVDSGQWTYPAG